ncbi:pantetheine-phosphate adenylyltransferase [Mycoplasmopsis gallinacea]|uniref:Phosphopantetheine adenylyltransferase n=1 Tax=Mycoplasmopsis gallinacea TaxID=29556 RepID=A0A6H0V318_9BACT|nr:pantetheine-phosphate adenylyltransferase [Mycoplasmopsis gallinacea]QIW61876.1 pantetheine-phosphate adenylyltransferase [Mycoplasmopsis gallinacea]
MKTDKKAIYAGSFDPFHDGHFQILQKAARLFDFVYVIVSINPDKPDASDIDIRYNNTKKLLSNLTNVQVLKNKDRFIAEIAKELDVKYLVRSARDVIDFNYELELAAGNNSLNNELETVLLIPSYEYIKYSSTLIRHKEKMKKDV